jgi:hypothetical protein
MLPSAAMPMNDPSGLLFPHLRAITADLKRLFDTVYLSVPLATQRRQPQEMAWLEREPFFRVTCYNEVIMVGDDFLTLYETAARQSDAQQIIHLCYLDRVAFALQSAHRQPFINDLSSLRAQHTPMIYTRSAAAWQTHPENYYEFESMVTAAGKRLFGRSLDYAWCHIAIQAGRLLEVLPTIKRRDMAHVAEYILAARDEAQVKAVDWLAWEDPFILGRDYEELKQEREQSLYESHKRLAYAIPMLELLNEASNGWSEATW